MEIDYGQPQFFETAITGCICLVLTKKPQLSMGRDLKQAVVAKVLNCSVNGMRSLKSQWQKHSACPPLPIAVFFD